MPKKQFLHNNVHYSVDTYIDIRYHGSDCFELLDDFYFMGNIIPKDFFYDGASTPKTPFLQWLCPRLNGNAKAAAGHDFLCRKAKNQQERREADKTYYLLCLYAENVPKWKAIFRYLGVRIGACLGIGNNF